MPSPNVRKWLEAFSMVIVRMRICCWGCWVGISLLGDGGDDPGEEGVDNDGRSR